MPIRFRPTGLGPQRRADHDHQRRSGWRQARAASAALAPAGKLAVSGSGLFGGVPSCEHAEKTIWVANTGDCRLQVSSVAFKHPSKPWELVNNPFPASLAPGALLPVVLRYHAIEQYARVRELEIVSDDPDTPVRLIEVLAHTVWEQCGCEERRRCCEPKRCCCDDDGSATTAETEPADRCGRCAPSQRWRIGPDARPIRHRRLRADACARCPNLADRCRPQCRGDWRAPNQIKELAMDYKLELIAVPVSDVDRAKEFYVRIGFHADHDHTVSDEVRFVQLTPPGSACSIAVGRGLTDAEPGTGVGMQLVVDRRRPGSGRAARARGDGRRRAGAAVGPVRVLRRSRRQPLVGAGGSRPRLAVGTGAAQVWSTNNCDSLRPSRSNSPKLWHRPTDELNPLHHYIRLDWVSTSIGAFSAPRG